MLDRLILIFLTVLLKYLFFSLWWSFWILLLYRKWFLYFVKLESCPKFINLIKLIQLLFLVRIKDNSIWINVITISKFFFQYIICHQWMLINILLVMCLKCLVLVHCCTRVFFAYKIKNFLQILGKFYEEVLNFGEKYIYINFYIGGCNDLWNI